jgi:hypothetical protein
MAMKRELQLVPDHIQVSLGNPPAKTRVKLKDRSEVLCREHYRKLISFSEDQMLYGEEVVYGLYPAKKSAECHACLLQKKQQLPLQF